MERPIAGQVAIVTGGQGNGRTIALRLAQDGMDVVVADLRGEQAEVVAAEVRQAGRQALDLVIDVASAEDRQRMIVATLAAFGRLDVLVNNAGIVRAALPLDVDEAHRGKPGERVIRGNLFSDVYKTWHSEAMERRKHHGGAGCGRLDRTK